MIISIWRISRRFESLNRQMDSNYTPICEIRCAPTFLKIKQAKFRLLFTYLPMWKEMVLIELGLISSYKKYELGLCELCSIFVFEACRNGSRFLVIQYLNKFSKIMGLNFVLFYKLQHYHCDTFIGYQS